MSVMEESALTAIAMPVGRCVALLGVAVLFAGACTGAGESTEVLLAEREGSARVLTPQPTPARIRQQEPAEAPAARSDSRPIAAAERASGPSRATPDETRRARTSGANRNREEPGRREGQRRRTNGTAARSGRSVLGVSRPGVLAVDGVRPGPGPSPTWRGGGGSLGPALAINVRTPISEPESGARGTARRRLGQRDSVQGLFSGLIRRARLWHRGAADLARTRATHHRR